MIVNLFVNQRTGRWTLVVKRGSAVMHRELKEYRWDEVPAVKRRVKDLLQLDRAPRWRKVTETRYTAEVKIREDVKS